MTSISSTLFDPSISVRLTQTLLHFLWQGAVLGFASWLFGRVFRTANAWLRYGIHLVILGLMALCVPVTFGLIDSRELTKPEMAGVETIDDVRQNRLDEASALSPAFDTNPDVALSADVVREAAASLSPTTGNNEVSVRAEWNQQSKIDSTIQAYAPWAVCAYISGVLAMLCRLCIALWGVHRLCRTARLVESREQLSTIRAIATQIGLRTVPLVAYCERVTIPMVVGIVRPMILLPVWLATEMDPEQVLVILAHEMAHIRRHDLLVNLLQRILETILFFHPAVWYVSRQVSTERENCCDDTVVRSGCHSLQYASTLVRLAELCASNIRQPATTQSSVAADGGSGTQLKQRVIRLLGEQQRLRLTRSDSLTLLLIAGIIVGSIAVVRHDVFAVPPEKGVTQKVDEGGKSAVDQPVALNFSGTVVDRDGKAIAGADIWLATTRSYPDKAIVEHVGVSDQTGMFQFQSRFRPEFMWDLKAFIRGSQVIVRAKDYGFDQLPLAVFETDPKDVENSNEIKQAVDKVLGDGRFASRKLVLPPEAGPIQGRLVDLEGRPLSNVTVKVDSLQSPDVTILKRAFKESSKDLVYQAMNSRRVFHGAWMDRNAWQVVFPSVKTNENGEFVLQGLGQDQLMAVTLQGENIAAEEIHILGTEMEQTHVPHVPFYPNGAQDLYVGINFSLAVGPTVLISGTVSEFKTGKPIANASVYVERLFRKEGMGSQLRFAHHLRTFTDDQGHYKLAGLPPGEGHVLFVKPPTSEPWLMASHEISLDPKQQHMTVDIPVFRGIWLEGKVTDADTKQPIKGFVDYLALQSNPNTPESAGLNEGWEMHRFLIDESGRYRVAGVPGEGVLNVRSVGETVYPFSVGAENVPGYVERGNYAPTRPVGYPLSNWHLIQLVNPAIDQPAHQQDLTLSAGKSISGRIVGSDGLPALNIEAIGLVEKNSFWDPLKHDQFMVSNYQPRVARNLFFKNSDNSLVGYLHIEQQPTEKPVVQLQPAITVRGRVIETETNDVGAGYGLYCDSTSKGNFRIEECLANKEGQFEIKGLLAGTVYKITVANARRFSSGKNDFTIDLSNAKPGEVIELGEVSGKNAKSAKDSK